VVVAAEEGAARPLTTQDVDLAKDAVSGDRFSDTVKHRPLGIRIIVEFAGTF
jgi:hypothetical protein